MRRLSFETCERRDLLAVNLVADLNATPNATSPSFVQEGGVTFVETEQGFYVSDGTLEGTRPVEDPRDYIRSHQTDSEHTRALGGEFFARRRAELVDGQSRYGIWFAPGGEQTSEVEIYSSPRELKLHQPTVLGDRLFFFTEGVAGLSFGNLVATNGTPEGTQTVSVPGIVVRDMATAGGELFLLGQMIGPGGSEPPGVWKFDAEQASFDVVPGLIDVRSMESVDGKLLALRANELVLYRPDGIEKLGDVAGTEFEVMATTGSEVYLEVGMQDLWYSDLTPQGTYQIDLEGWAVGDDWEYPAGLSQETTVLLFETVRFSVRNDVDAQLARLEFPTPENPRPAVEILAEFPGGMFSLQNLNQNLVFIARGQLWTTDVTVEGTQPMTNVFVEPHNRLHIIDGHKVLFSGAADGKDYELWVSDGTAVGTFEVVDLADGTEDANYVWQDDLPVLVDDANGQLHTVTESGVFQFDDSFSKGTKIGDIVPELPRSSEFHFTTLQGSGDDKLFFTAYETDSRAVKRELWAPNDAGELESIWSASGEDNHFRTPIMAWDGDLAPENQVLFMMNRRTHSQLWVSDGTRLGTRMLVEGSVAEVTPIGVFFYRLVGEANYEFVRIDTRTLVETTIATTESICCVKMASSQSHLAIAQRELLFLTDGETTETLQVSDRGYLIRELQSAISPDSNVMYFHIDEDHINEEDGSNGYIRRLWRTDGTRDGTFVLPATSAQTENAIYSAGITYFVGKDEDGASAVWSSDGTVKGTVPIVSTQDSSPAFRFVGDDLYVVDEVESKLIVFDTVDKISRVVHTFERPTFNIQSHFIETEGSSFFMDRTRFMSTNGIESTPVLLLEPNQSIGSTASFGSVVVFTIEGENSGDGIWRSDGTAEGTYLISNVPAEELIAFQDRVFFRGTDAVHGAELWSTDGTVDGTRMEADIFPGRVGSSPDNFFATENALAFTANDNQHGREIWRYVPDEQDPGNAPVTSGGSDLNGDGIMGFADFLILASNFGESDKTWADGDLSGNALVDFEDFLVLAFLFGDEV